MRVGRPSHCGRAPRGSSRGARRRGEGDGAVVPPDPDGSWLTLRPEPGTVAISSADPGRGAQRMVGGRRASGTTAVSPAAVFADGTPLNLYGIVPTPGWTTYAAPGSPDSQAMIIASATSAAESTGKFAAVKCSRIRSMIAVSANPGQIAVIVVPSAASRGAIERTNAIAPPLATL